MLKYIQYLASRSFNASILSQSHTCADRPAMTIAVDLGRKATKTKKKKKKNLIRDFTAIDRFFIIVIFSQYTAHDQLLLENEQNYFLT